jgi:DNA-binding CsgD family transcriptional regulator
LQNAIREFLREQEAGLADPHWHDLTHRVCLDLFDQDTYNFLISRQVEALRAAGALTVLPVALVTHAGMCVTAGQFTKAAALLEESAVIIEATGAPVPGSIHTYLAAYRGQEQLCRKLIQTTIAGATTRGEGYEISVAQYAAAILHNGLGQYAEAIAAASSGAAYDDIGIHGYLLTELVEAAARGGEAATAEDAFRRLSERTQASGTDTALGVAARSAALVSDGRSAEAEYQRAIAHLQRSPAVVYLARTQLIYGEWLRRMKRRADARIQLRIAHDMFVQMGADGFTRRARRELTAAGEIVHASHGGAVAALTAQESHIASLASDGYTNSEIASHLFISPRTVEWHLSRIFAKLGVASRRDLRSAPALMQE